MTKIDSADDKSICTPASLGILTSEAHDVALFYEIVGPIQLPRGISVVIASDKINGFANYMAVSDHYTVNTKVTTLDYGSAAVNT